MPSPQPRNFKASSLPQRRRLPQGSYSDRHQLTLHHSHACTGPRDWRQISWPTIPSFDFSLCKEPTLLYRLLGFCQNLLVVSELSAATPPAGRDIGKLSPRPRSLQDIEFGLGRELWCAGCTAVFTVQFCKLPFDPSGQDCPRAMYLHTLDARTFQKVLAWCKHLVDRPAQCDVQGCR